MEYLCNKCNKHMLNINRYGFTTINFIKIYPSKTLKIPQK